MISDRGLAIWGTILGILGIILSIYFYFLSIAERKPIFLLDENSHVVIVSNSEVSESSLSVTRKDGKPINADVNAVKFYFWNSGKLPIKKDNILKPLNISLPDGSDILSYKITSSTREIVSEKLTLIDKKISLLTLI